MLSGEDRPTSSSVLIVVLTGLAAWLRRFAWPVVEAPDDIVED